MMKMAQIKLSWVAEAFPKIRKNISKLYRTVKALPSEECTDIKYIDKRYESYAKALSNVFNDIGLKAFYQHIGMNEAKPGELWPKWKITVKRKGEGEPLASMEVHPAMHSGTMQNVGVLMNRKEMCFEKCFNYKDFKSAIEYLINNSND